MSEYSSTRSRDNEVHTYGDVLLEGLAPDGGLYVPTEYIQYAEADLRAMSRMSYPDLFVAVKSRFVGDSMTLEQQHEHAVAAYTTEKFPDVVDGNYTPVRQISHNLFIQNLSFGPTAAFKDMALQPLGRDIRSELARRGEHLRILGATSGDTGSSAEASLKDLPGIELFMLSPQEGMSEFQRAQMAALSGGNIHNIAIDGRFDACQDLVKELKKDPEFADLGAVNSINWGRIASQVPYYFSGYFQAIEQSGGNIGDEVDFVVPSGNMGNVFAGHIARNIGLPIRRIVVATNENNVLHRLIQTGEYSDTGSRVTTSPSMDISKASNYERIVHDLFDADPSKTRAYMERFAREGRVTFAEFGLAASALQALGFESGTSAHADRIATIRELYDHGHGIVDPHTADGLSVVKTRGPLSVPTVCMETALPVKFEPTIREAIGRVPERPERFRGRERALGNKAAFYALPADAEQLKTYIRLFSRYSSGAW